MRAPFALAQTAFDAFLTAPIGDEANGSTLSVISALARQGIDPWDEAALLSGMSPAAAASALVAIIAQLPAGSWTLPDLPGIADRLVALLPDGATQRAQERPTASAKYGAVWLAFLVISTVFFGYILLRGPSSDDSGAADFVTRESIQAPVHE